MKPWYFEFKYILSEDVLASDKPVYFVDIDLPLSNFIRFTYSDKLQIQKIEFFYYNDYRNVEIPIEIKDFTEEEMFQYSLIYDHSKLIELNVFLAVYKYIENVKAHLNYRENFTSFRAIITGED